MSYIVLCQEITLTIFHLTQVLRQKLKSCQVSKMQRVKVYILVNSRHVPRPKTNDLSIDLGTSIVYLKTYKAFFSLTDRRCIVVSKPQYPKLFRQFKGRFRAIEIYRQNNLKQTETTFKSSLKIPKCSSVRYSCLLGGIRLIGGWNNHVQGRLQTKAVITTKPGTRVQS